MQLPKTFAATPMLERPKTVAFFSGMADASPLLLGVVPFGLVYGMAAVAAGFSPAYTSLLSFTVFAGASQLAAIQLLTDNGPLLPALVAGLVINMRMLLYSASIAPHFKGRSLLHKCGLAYFLTDQAYAVSMARFAPGYPEERKSWYYLGGGGIIWAGFGIGTICGATLGANLPQSLDLGFAVPLTFLALLAPHLQTGYGMAVAITSGAAVILCRALPYNCSVLVAVFAGIIVGSLLEWRNACKPCTAEKGGHA